MARTCAFLFLLLFLLSGMARGQDVEHLPRLHPSAVTPYDINRGLPLSCLGSMVVDPRGRLFINPCDNQDIYRDLGFFQFDGSKSHQILLDPPAGTSGPMNWSMGGLTPGGLLYGTDEAASMVFLYQPDQGSQQLFALDPDERFGNLFSGPDNEVYLLTTTKAGYTLYTVSMTAKALLTRIPESGVMETDPEVNIPALRSGDRIWFIRGEQGFVGYSLPDGQIYTYLWRDLLGVPHPGVTNTSTEAPFVTGPTMTVAPDGKLLLYNFDWGGFYTFDPQKEELSPQSTLNAASRRLDLNAQWNIYFFPDHRQNLLVHFGRLPGAEKTANDDLIATILWDREGRMFDYKPVTKMAAAGRYSKSSVDFMAGINFKKQVLIGTIGGLIAVEVKTDLPIRSAAEGFASRAMGDLGQGRVVISSESGNKSVLNLTTLKSNLLGDRDAQDPLHWAHNYTQYVTRNGNLWYSADKGLIGYSPQGSTVQVFDVGQLFDKFQFIGDREIALVNTDNELFRFDLDQRRCSPVLVDGAPLNIGGTPNELEVDRTGILWIASLNGLWRVDPQTGACQHVGKADGLVDDQILCIHEGEDGDLWLGTLAGGLQVYNSTTGVRWKLDQGMGLSNNSVVGILSDPEGDRWVSTFDGITVVSPSGKIRFELSEEDGLTHREFNRYSALKTEDGNMLFGGVNGITLIDPLRVKGLLTEQDELHIYLTGVSWYDRSEWRETHLTTDLDRTERIVLPAAHRYIRLDFGLSDYTAPDKCAFSYRLVHKGDEPAGLEKDALWTNIGPGSELLLNDLPVGSYTILVRGMNGRGQVTEHPLAIPVKVQEFFYRTWWFYLLCALPFLIGAYVYIRRLQTERERLEAEVESRTQQIRRDKTMIEGQAAKLQELDELKTRFFTNISHEFRTPLTVISGMVTQIRKEPEAWLDKGMELIQRNSQQLLKQINQILDLRKLESGALTLHLIRNNVVPYLRYIAESFVQMSQAKGLRIHVLADTDLVEMDYDPDKLMHILSNLLSNAIKYTPAPGDIYLQIGTGIVDGQEHLTVQVRDTGQGIAPEALPFIFDQFYQVEDLATQKPTGSGIGLALTRELVVLLGGTIRATSTPGKGTTFNLSFPITLDAPVQENMVLGGYPVREATEVEAIPASSADAGTDSSISEDPPEGLASLLIVEDNPDVRLVLQACLEPHYRLLFARDGEEGIALAVEQVPDLIVSDVLMPKKDGFALCDALKYDERTSHIPIILLTAKADFESKLQGLRRGADAYLTKPFDQEELLVRLERLLALRLKLQERYRDPAFTGQEPGPEAAATEDAFILKLRQLVLDHLDEEDYGIVHLCRAMGVGRTQLHNKIKALTGGSTSEFVRTVRLNRARVLLQTTDMNVSEVSYEVGISNPNYFSRIYSETFGEAPRDTRR